MFVRMKADGTVQAKGFIANYTRVSEMKLQHCQHFNYVLSVKTLAFIYCQGCGARIVTEGTGVLTSPNYPHSWEDGGECDWVIVGARPCG